jgi:bifunctional enzyme CysN/CysC
MSSPYAIPVLAELEAEAIHTLREAAGQFQRPAVLDAGDEDSRCLRRLAERAFAPGAVPFPVIAPSAAQAGYDAVIDAARHAGEDSFWGLLSGRATLRSTRVSPLANWSESDVSRYLSAEPARAGLDLELLRFLLVGSAGDGKSTLLERMAKGAGASRHFTTGRRSFVATDTPGDVSHTRELAAGASSAELAIVVIDATRGVQAQTRRHTFICSLLGIPRLVVAINKMDLAGYSQERFDKLRRDFEAFAPRLSFKSITFLPVSAREGDNVLKPSRSMPWYPGQPLLDHLETVYIGGDRNLVDLRFPVQAVVRLGRERWYLGRVASGAVKPGDEVVVLPSHRRSRVREVRLHERSLDHAFAPLSLAVALADDIDAGRGAWLAHPRNLPHAARALDAMVIWLGEAPLAPGRVYLVKHGASSTRGSCAEVNYRMDADTLHRGGGGELQRNDIGRASFTLFEERFVDAYAHNRATGGFIVVDADTQATVGAGMIVDRESEPARVERGQEAKRVVVPHASKVTGADRARLLGQRAVTVWLTGLSGAGKSTLATELERYLVNAGRACYMLDGDNVRAGINRDLGFGPDDRRENIRRIAEVARLMNDAGLLVVTAFISPYRADRDMARGIIGTETFLEVFVDSPLGVCEARDPKGLYRKARKGEIPEFTGISAPYEAPESPALKVDTAACSVDACVGAVMDLIRTRARA